LIRALSLAPKESLVRRPQKPFSVEVKRARKGAASGAPVFISKPAPLEAHKSETPPIAPPEREKPRGRILEAIEPDLPPPVVDETSIAGASPRAESAKPRRGRPRKVQLAPEAPVARVNYPARAKSGARRDTAAALAHARRETFVIFEPAPVQKSQEGNGIAAKMARPAHVGHVDHASRVLAASDLPRGERWKRRLPKVLW
jgi:hypothetical protein